MKKEIIIEGSRIHDKSSFFEEINRKFMQNESWQLAESLDAFDDLLYGGFGAVREKEEITLIWENFEANRAALGAEFTINYYQEKLNHPDDFDSSIIQKRLNALKEGKGQTYFEILQEIITEHSNIELIKK